MARLRIIQEAYNQIKLEDPETALTICALRRIIKTEGIPTIRIGRKSLIDYDILVQYLQTGSQHSDSNKSEEIGEIRKITW
jgi:hypothetical protein